MDNEVYINGRWVPQKVVDGIVVREAVKDVWVSQQGDVWKENVHLSNQFGRVKTTSQWYQMKKSKDPRKRVHIRHPELGALLRYRLVAMVWVPNPKPGEYDVINHLDGNPANDVASNLEWCDQSRNVQHAYDIGLHKVDRIISDEEGMEILEEYLALGRKGRTPGVNRAEILAKKYGRTTSQIKHALRRARKQLKKEI